MPERGRDRGLADAGPEIGRVRRLAVATSSGGGFWLKPASCTHDGPSQSSGMGRGRAGARRGDGLGRGIVDPQLQRGGRDRRRRHAALEHEIRGRVALAVRRCCHSSLKKSGGSDGAAGAAAAARALLRARQRRAQRERRAERKSRPASDPSNRHESCPLCGSRRSVRRIGLDSLRFCRRSEPVAVSKVAKYID